MAHLTLNKRCACFARNPEREMKKAICNDSCGLIANCDLSLFHDLSTLPQLFFRSLVNWMIVDFYVFGYHLFFSQFSLKLCLGVCSFYHDSIFVYQIRFRGLFSVTIRRTECLQ